MLYNSILLIPHWMYWRIMYDGNYHMHKKSVYAENFPAIMDNWSFHFAQLSWKLQPKQSWLHVRFVTTHISCYLIGKKGKVYSVRWPKRQ